MKKFKIYFEFEPYDYWTKNDVKEMIEKVIDPIYHLGDSSISEINIEEIEVEDDAKTN
ncbi:hypothetical protein [Finegoldia magna]|uniref:hypothetical protein n=1 Tax=Finegoldia magna TaxID=1260 RepID=UPI0023AA1101|nr:hypothetical protein [Finegoldia magna]MCC2717273.1 hypothetical protein [Finegoldia magna]